MAKQCLNAHAPVAMSAEDAHAALPAAAEGLVALRAPLTFATAGALYPVGVEHIRAAGTSALTLDLQGVSRIDSAGLALLIDWLALARSHGCSLRYAHCSDALRALAQLSDVQELLAA